MSGVLTSQDKNQEPKRFDLFWLTKKELGTLIEGQHHGPLDSTQNTKTEINIFQTAQPICMALSYLDKSWAVDILEKIKQEDKARFTLTPEFLQICNELEINIPFLEIEAGRLESIDGLVKRARQCIEGQSKSIEKA